MFNITELISKLEPRVAALLFADSLPDDFWLAQGPKQLSAMHRDASGNSQRVLEAMMNLARLRDELGTWVLAYGMSSFGSDERSETELAIVRMFPSMVDWLQDIQSSDYKIIKPALSSLLSSGLDTNGILGIRHICPSGGGCDGLIGRALVASLPNQSAGYLCHIYETIGEVALLETAIENCQTPEDFQTVATLIFQDGNFNLRRNLRSKIESVTDRSASNL